jgi:hypothetical protein
MLLQNADHQLIAGKAIDEIEIMTKICGLKFKVKGHCLRGILSASPSVCFQALAYTL